MFKFRNTAALGTCLLFMVFQFAGGASPVIQQSNPFSSLTLEISSNSRQFLIAEPIPIVLTLSNRTSQPVIGHSALKLDQNYIDLYVRRNEGEPIKISYLTSMIKQFIADPREIKPGEQIQSKNLLTLDLDRHFSEVGVYELFAVLRDVSQDERVESDVLTINISQPQGTDKRALQHLRRLSNEPDFLSEVNLVRNIQKQRALEGLVTDFPGSPYSDYAAYLLGQLSEVRGEYEKAIGYFSRLANKPDFIFADKALEYLSEIRAKQQKLN